MHGFDLQLLPVTSPGVEQKSTWLQIRQSRPDYVLLWGWGVMNSTALKEAVATGYPREKMYGVWWSGAEPDVKDVGDGAKGYNARGDAARRRAGREGRQGHPDAGARQGPGHRAEGRGRLGAVHARRDRARCSASKASSARRSATARARSMTGEQARWGLENLALDQKKLDALGFAGVMRPVSTTCADHMGASLGAHPHLGRHQVGLHLRLVRRPTSRSSSRWSRQRPTSTRPRRRSRGARRRTARAERPPAGQAMTCGTPR